MRGRKQLLTILALAALLAASCEKYDDTEVTSALEAQERTLTRQGESIASLERSLAETNTNLSSLGTLIAGYSASQDDKVTIRSYIPLEGGKGYTVTLTDGNTITIYNGSDGKDGSDGKNGSDGKDGSDGVVPIRGENGNWIIGGTEIPNPSDGKDGLVPHVGENGNWFIGDTDTGVRGTGHDGSDGSDGEVPTIGDNGNWIISGTEIPNPSDGKDGLVPYIGDNGDWWIGDTDTGVRYSGKDGKAAREITIGITEVGGVQVWSVYGKPLTDSEGNPVPVAGEAGKDGVPGTSIPGEPGKDGLSPRIKVMDGWLCYSFDNASWNRICPSRGERGEAGDAGADGVSAVKAVAPSTDGKRLNITLADGTVWSMTVEKQAYIVINKQRTSLTAYVGDQSFVMNKVEKCTFTMGANTYKAPCPGVADQYVDYKHQVTLTKTYWIMESWIIRDLQAAVEGAAGETMPKESILLYENKNREFIAFYSNWWTELTKIYGDVFSMEFNIPTEAQLERAMGTGACYCVNAIASDWFYYPLSRNEDKIDPTGWISSWFGYGKVHKSNELQNCLDYQTRTGITLRSSSIDRKDRYQTKGDYGNIHLVIYDSDLSI